MAEYSYPIMLTVILIFVGAFGFYAASRERKGLPLFGHRKSSS